MKSKLVLMFVILTSVGCADRRREIAFPDIGGYLTLKCDFHTHTVFSDGEVWPDVRVEEAWREGLDVISITDHIEYTPHKNDIPKDPDRPFEIARQKAMDMGILLIKGAELTFPTPPGHFNALFVQDITKMEAKEFMDEVENANQQGGFVFWNHPDWKGPQLGQWNDTYSTLVENGWMHGIEVANGETYYSRAHQWCLEKNLTMMGNSDIHEPSMRLANTDKDHRTMMLVFADKKTVPAVKEALQKGRTAVWWQDKLIGKKEFLEPLFYASVKIHMPHFTDKQNTRFNVTNHSEITLVLERTGNAGPKEITLPSKETVLLTMPKQHSDYAYKVKNFLVTPKEGLQVSLKIPEPIQLKETAKTE